MYFCRLFFYLFLFVFEKSLLFSAGRFIHENTFYKRDFSPEQLYYYFASQIFFKIL